MYKISVLGTPSPGILRADLVARNKIYIVTSCKWDDMHIGKPILLTYGKGVFLATQTHIENEQMSDLYVRELKAGEQVIIEG